ncbi:preQ(1) synthase [Dehalococcoidia bacterium]|nr:preQ(1) synthase [Dehalococcoidia bacterium]
MVTTQEFQRKYERLSDRSATPSPESDIDADCLMAFDYEYQGQDAEVEIDTDEFTAVCPWTCLPDFGTLRINYVPDRLCIELKSLKHYLLSYTGVGIVQEHAANRILDDLVGACHPKQMILTLDYKVRGGIHTAVTVRYKKDET